MTQTHQDGNAPSNSVQELTTPPYLAQIAYWQRVAVAGAAVGAAAILVCSLGSLRPLPSVAPPPDNIAPLMPVAAPGDSAGGATIGAPALPNGVAPVGNAGAPVNLPMNALAYLTFVKQIDQQRLSLAASFDAALAGNQNQAPQGASSVSPAASALAQTAQSLQTTFQAQAAPPECANLATAYGKLLQDQSGLIAQASPPLASGDLRGASALAAGAMRQLQTDASAADEALGAVSASAQTPKAFVIAADPTQSSSTVPGASGASPPPGGQPGSVPNANGAPAPAPQPSQTTAQPERTFPYAPAASSNPPTAPQSADAPYSSTTTPTPAL